MNRAGGPVCCLNHVKPTVLLTSAEALALLPFGKAR